MKIKTVILLLILSINLSAQDYYVDQVNGSNSNSGTSPSNAFKKFSDAKSAVSPGGTIYIMGEYHNSSYDPSYTYGSPSDAHLWNAENSIKINGLNGTSGNYITIKGYDNNSVIKGDGANILRVVNCSYLIFEDLNIEGEVDNIPLSTANALQFVYIDANTANATNPSPSDIHYRNEDETNDNDNIVEETDTYTDLSSMNVKRPSYVDTRGFYLSNVNHIDIKNCHIHLTCGGGLRVSDGEYVNIIGNEIDNCSRRSYSGTHALVVTKTHSTNNLDDNKIVIENNIIHHNYNEQYSWAPTKTIITPRIDEGKGISLQRNNADDWMSGHGRILVKNNLTYWNGFSGVHSNDGDRIDFINNTAFMNSYTNSVTYPSGDQAGNNIGISLSGDSDNPMQDTKLINNVVVIDTDWNGFPISIANVNTSSPNVKIRNNIVYGINGAVTTDSDVSGIQVATLEQDPKFVNAPAGYQNTSYNFDFHLQSSSPAIDYADANYTPALDIEGTTRDANPDAGAYEYTSTSNIPVTSITVQGQGGVSTITTDGGTLQMEATLLPSNATNPTYTWSVINGTGQATIDASGVLTAVADGDVTVRATANDGSGVYGEAVITISNQASSNNMIFQSISVTQASTSDVYTGTTDNEVLKIEIVTTGTDNPINVEKFRMNLNGSSLLADIDATKAYYTGTNNTFSTNSLYGTMGTPSSLTGYKNIAGNQLLSEGSNYFWISIDISGGATVGDVIDARILKVFIDGTDVLNATEQDPAGNRTIVSSTTAPVANFTGTPLSICPGESVTFTDASTNTPTSWSWDFGDTQTDIVQNPTHTYTTAGIYTVSLTVTNADGSDTKTIANYVTVNPTAVAPSSVSASSSTICEGESTILTYQAGSGDTFNWYTGSCGGSLVGSGNNLSVSPTSTTTYYGRWESSCGNSTCESVTVTVNTVPSLSMSATNASCGNTDGTATVSATGGTGSYSYLWDDPSAQATATASNLGQGVYNVTVTSGACTATGNATVNEDGAPTVSVSASETTICEGETTVLTASGADSYSWSPATNLDATTGTTVNASPTADIMYTVTGTTAGCSASANVSITVNHTPVVGFTVDNSAEPVINFTNTTTGADSYSWDLGDGTIETTTDVSHEYTSNNTYTVILSATNGCGTENYQEAVTITNIGIVSLNQSSINIYPNPTESIINVKLPIDNVTLNLVNMDGKVLRSIETKDAKQGQMNIEDLATGIYNLIIITDHHERVVIKVIKK